MRDLAAGRRTWRDVAGPRLLNAMNLLSRPLVVDTSRDPYHQTIAYFVEEANRRPMARILELGSRNAKIDPRFAGYASYVGVDIHPGPNVDVVGDIHQLSELVSGPFDVVYSISTFEHLAMPWKAVLEINKVCEQGALLLVTSHPTWPPHEQPWDFWRFSASAFEVLLNRATGFELLRCSEGLPGVIFPLGTEGSTIGIHRMRVNMGVAAVAKKIGEPDPDFRWDLTAADLLETTYPLPPAASEESSATLDSTGSVSMARIQSSPSGSGFSARASAGRVPSSARST